MPDLNAASIEISDQEREGNGGEAWGLKS